MVKTWDFILKVKEKTPRSLKQRGGSINHPFTVENGVIWLSRSDLHCVSGGYVLKAYSPQSLNGIELFGPGDLHLRKVDC